MHLLKRLIRLAFVLPASLALVSAAQAATRTYIVTDFDTVRLEAPIAVAVETKRGVTARGEGDVDLLDRIDLSVSARVLTVRLKRSPFESRRGDAGAVRLFLTVPALRRAQLAGAGTLAIDGLTGQSADIVAAGDGVLSVANVSADTLSVVQQGAGAIRLAGKTGKAILALSGNGGIDASALTASDLEATAEGTGAIKALATRSAKLTAIGAAAIAIDGQPGCTVRHAGSGAVSCGGQEY